MSASVEASVYQACVSAYLKAHDDYHKLENRPIFIGKKAARKLEDNLNAAAQAVNYSIGQVIEKWKKKNKCKFGK